MGVAVHPIHAGGGRALKRPARKGPTSPLDKAKAHEVEWKYVSGVFDVNRCFEGACYVYFIGEQDDGPVKIGVAKDPIVRLRTMQTGNPRRLRVERLLVGDMALEKLLHEFWEPFAIATPVNRKKVGAPPGTEWFAPELRERLFPIVETAADNQIEWLSSASGATDFKDVEQIVRDAHKEHDFVLHQRDQVHLLAAGAGYVVSRPSRL